MGRIFKSGKLAKEVGASLVEMGLLVSLIALVAVPSVNRIGISNSCQICHLRHCTKYSDDYCDPGLLVGDWSTDCVNNYVANGWRDYCSNPF